MNRSPDVNNQAYREYQARQEMTLEERLAEERIVFLWGEISPNTAGGLIMRLLELQAKSRDRDINVYINSPGGSVDDTLAVYDTMQFLSCDVATFCVGQAADIKIQAEEILKAKRLLNELLAQHTGRSVETIEQETERDRYMTPSEAKEYGIVDEIVQEQPESKQ